MDPDTTTGNKEIRPELYDETIQQKQDKLIEKREGEASTKMPWKKKHQTMETRPPTEKAQKRQNRRT